MLVIYDLKKKTIRKKIKFGDSDLVFKIYSLKIDGLKYLLCERKNSNYCLLDTRSWEVTYKFTDLNVFMIMEDKLKLMIQRGNNCDLLLTSTKENRIRSFNISLNKGFLEFRNHYECERQKFEIKDF